MNLTPRTLIAVTAAVGLLVSAAPASAQPDHAVPPSCTIEGGDGDDVLRGTPAADVICGNGGDDVLLGYDGDDVLRGGAGDDTLIGGPGNDELYGDDGDDQLVDTRNRGAAHGGAGTDQCIGASSGSFTDCEQVHRLPRADDVAR